MYGVMVGIVNLICYAPGKVTYHMACRYDIRKPQEYVMCVVHNASHVRYCKCCMPCTRKYMPDDTYVTLEMSRLHDVSALVNPTVNFALYCTKRGVRH